MHRSGHITAISIMQGKVKGRKDYTFLINREHEKKLIRPEIANFLQKPCFVTSLSELHLKHLPGKLLLLSESSSLELDQKTHAGTCVEKQQDLKLHFNQEKCLQCLFRAGFLPGNSSNS